MLELLQRLKEELGLGRTVEAGPVDEVFERPRHPYTQALLSAVPQPDPKRERGRQRTRSLLPGDPPSPTLRCDGLPLPCALPAVRHARRGGAEIGVPMRCRSSTGTGWRATSRAYARSSSGRNRRAAGR
ncbi:oligopeptide/dipeptide ABC transporter ATP-binding protein [Streptomyces sp. NPDC047043]|uniref:oligopeptide/dipeptide ABC transporter ATP-binding protein n=1 Tax=Streptomyces sp. NPDC047043 TaxID=3154497 RepID=UPI0033C86703